MLAGVTVLGIMVAHTVCASGSFIQVWPSVRLIHKTVRLSSFSRCLSVIALNVLYAVVEVSMRIFGPTSQRFAAYPIYSSDGGRLGGLTTSGDSRRRSNSSRV